MEAFFFCFPFSLILKLYAHSFSSVPCSSVLILISILMKFFDFKSLNDMYISALKLQDLKLSFYKNGIIQFEICVYLHGG